MTIFLLVLGLTGGVFSVWRLRVRNDRSKTWANMDDLILAGGAGGLSLFDVYMAAENHEQALDQLQRVMSTVIPEGAGSLDWLKEFEKIKSSGNEGMSGLVNLWKGSLAEERAVEALNHDPKLVEEGIRAVRFESPNHPDTDIHFVHSDGTPLTDEELHQHGLTDIQVKSYGIQNYDHFLETAHSHPDVTYMVNDELYSQLEQHGDLQGHGINVINGGWSDIELQDEANDIMDQMDNAADIAGDVPVIGIAIFGKRAWDQVNLYRKGKTSGYETALRTVGDATRMGVAVVGVAAGANIGAMIGTAIMPGVGTLAGAVLGGLVSGSFIRKLFRWITNQVLYGNLMGAYENIGETYRKSFFDPFSIENLNINNRLFGMNQLLELTEKERMLADKKKYKESIYEEPALPKALLYRSIKVSERMLLIAKTASKIYKEKFRNLFLKSVSKTYIQKSNGILGSFIAANEDFLLLKAGGYDRDLSLHRLEIIKKPDHPYRLRDNQKQTIEDKAVLKSLVAKSLEEAEEKIPSIDLFWTKKPIFLILLLIFSFLFLFYSVFLNQNILSFFKP
jgi:hypothetical protein